MRVTQNMINIKKVTPYPDINEILLHLSNEILKILGNNLIGLYLFGSLTYGDFNASSSDIDLVAIINRALNQNELEQVKQLHNDVAKRYKKWNDRTECSYTPIDMLPNILPPKEPRPYYGGGIFYDAADYGNEWIINNYLLYQHGIPLMGVDFKELIKPIDIIDVQKACIQDLFREWEPKITDSEWLGNNHYQSYIVMNLCRILYTVACGRTATKKVSSEWVRNKYGLKWQELIRTAENWEYGKKMSLKNATIDFISFVINEVKRTAFFKQIHTSD